MVGQVDAQGWWWPHGKPVLQRAPGKVYGSLERGSHAVTDLLEGPVTPLRIHAGGIYFLRTAPLEGPTLEQFMKNHNLCEGLTLKKFMEDSLQWEETYGGVEEDCEESSPWRGRSSRHNVSNTNPFPHCPPATVLRGRKEHRVKLSQRRRKRWREGILGFDFISHYPVHKLRFFHGFFLPIQLKRTDRHACWAPGIQSISTHQKCIKCLSNLLHTTMYKYCCHWE